MSAIYETGKSLAEYLLFHFGSPDDILPPDREWPEGMHAALEFPLRTASRFSPGTAARGLDLGCAVGRSTFEMSRRCEEVTGIDFSHAFIQAADVLAHGRSIDYDRVEEGHSRTRLTAAAPADVDPCRVRFFQGDAMNLPEELGSFDRVHAANLLCRLPDPERLLERFPDLVTPGGELVLATPCTWLEEFTPPAKWPAGDTFAWLDKALTGAFTLVTRAEEPFLIRETARKFQWTSSMLTVWKRNG